MELHLAYAGATLAIFSDKAVDEKHSYIIMNDVAFALLEEENYALILN